ncbi:MAG: hypothetical protein R3E68_01720 [Burkholderiaceae bacterium]
MAGFMLAFTCLAVASQWQAALADETGAGPRLIDGGRCQRGSKRLIRILELPGFRRLIAGFAKALRL